MKTSMKTIKDRFTKAPYGFVEDDVNWLIARLFKRGDLSFTVNGASVTLLNKSEEELVNIVTKKQYVDKLLMEVRVRVDDRDKKAVRDVMKELFHVSSAADDEDTVKNNFQNYAQKMIYEMERLEGEYQRYDYPGKKTVNDGMKLLRSVLQYTAPLEFFQYVSKQRENFYDLAEDYEPVKAFFAGEQKQIFQRALDMLEIYEDSKTYIVDAELEEIVVQMKTIVRKPVPYGDIPKLPELREKFMDVYTKILDGESAPVLDSIDQDRERVLEVIDTKPYRDSKRERYLEQFSEIRQGAEKCNNISSLRSFADKADALKIRLLNEMDQLDLDEAKKKAEEERRKQGQEAQETSEPFADRVAENPATYKVRKTKNVSMKSMTHTASWRLENAEDVDKYLGALRESLLAEMDENTILNVEI